MSNSNMKAAVSGAFVLLLGAVWLRPAATTEAAFRFEDVTQSSGIRFTTENGATPEKFLIETMGSGLGFLDFDSDGLQDLVFVNGGGKPGSAASRRDRLALYRNMGQGKFTDVTARAGLRGDFATYGMGIATADYDNDGHPDLLVSGYPRSLLFHNNGDGSFTGVTAVSGVSNEGHWGTSAGWFDYDRDGRLDLVIANYVADFSWDDPRYCGERKPGYRSYCHPDGFRGTSPTLFHNEGDGKFRDVTAESGILSKEGKCLGLVLADLNGDGWPDIFVANDSTRNFLYINRGNGKFEEQGLLAGVAFSEDGRTEAGMGVDVADVDGDLRLDLYLTHLDRELNRLYRGNGKGTWFDATVEAGLGKVTIRFSGFGVKFADFDNSGRRHILTANGHILDNIELYHSDVTYAEPLTLLENDGRGKFTDASRSLPAVHLIGRGLALADFDNDGLLDFAVSQNVGSPLLVRNRSKAGHWIALRLEGAGKSNRDAIGAQVTIRAGGIRQVDQVAGASSYCSAQDSRVHFGLGPQNRIETLEIRWPSGKTETHRDLAVDRTIRVTEGKGVVTQWR